MKIKRPDGNPVFFLFTDNPICIAEYQAGRPRVSEICHSESAVADSELSGEILPAVRPPVEEMNSQ